MEPRLPPRLAPIVKKVNLITPSEWLAKVDAWRRDQPGLPNRSEAIRKLVEMGLDTAQRSEAPSRHSVPKPKGRKPE